MSAAEPEVQGARAEESIESGRESGSESGSESGRNPLPALLAFIGLVHLPLLNAGLVYDDGWTLRSNGFLRPGHFELGLLFSPEGAARHIPDAFRPTLVVFDMLSYRLVGLRPWAHHGLSVALHVGVCALLARLLTRLGARRELTLAATACFGLLAVHAEVVAVVSYREDLLAALFGLAALLACLRISEAEGWGRRLGWTTASAAAMALACGAKLSAAPLIALPLLLSAPAGLCPWPASRRLRGSALALALAGLTLGVGLALAQTALVHGGLSPYLEAANPRVFASRVGLGPVLAASAQIHLAYLGQVALPFGPFALSPEYVDRGASWTAVRTLVALAVLGSATIAALTVTARGLRGHGQSLPARALALAFLVWIALCIPTSNLVGLPNMRADRFLYLPSLPLCVAAAAGLLSAGRWVAGRWVAADSADLGFNPAPLVPLALFIFMQASFGLATARVYVSNSTLWHAAIRRAPDSARAHALLGIERLAIGRRAETLDPEIATTARQDCLHAQELDPLYELPEICLARLAVAERDWAAAYAHHARAVELSVDRNDRSLAALAQLALDLPSDWLEAHPELGGDRRALALAHIERGLSAYPYSPELHVAAGRVYHRLGQPERALELYRRARSLRPDRWETVAAGVELTLDLGDAPAAHRTWWTEQELLGRADPATRTRLMRRLAEARKQPDFSLLHSLLSPGVFPDGL